MLKPIPLITVQALSARLAKQIQIASFSEARTIIQLTQKQKLKPKAWAQGEYLDGIPDNTHAWLFEFKNQLWWVAAPYPPFYTETYPEWVTIALKDTPQVFIK